MQKALGVLTLSGQKVWHYLPYLFVVAVLYFSYRFSYLFFHTAVEIITFGVSFSLFILIWNIRKIIRNNFLIFLGIIFFSVGIINFFHLLSYKGMPIFSMYADSLSSQLWIAERFLLAASLPFALHFINRKLDQLAALLTFIAITALVLSSIFLWNIFPATYIVGKGLTLFKIISEYVIVAIFVIDTCLLYRERSSFNERTYRLLTLSLILNIAAELLFTLYTDLYAFSNVVAHIIIFFSYLFVYKAIVEIGLTDPYNLFFREIREADHKKDEIMSITSHELKNPVTSIKLYSELMLTELEKRKQNEKISHIARQIHAQTHKVTRIINDLSDVAKITTGQMVVNKSQVDLPLVLMDIVENVQLRNPTRKIILKISKVPSVFCDRERIAQVVENLISNAIKYSKANTPVNIRLEEKKGYATISIKDRGVGIAKKDLRKIFDKYYRLNTDKAVKGLGLGLYISKEIVDLHQGRIWVESAPDKGSTFSFSLPASGS